MRQCKQNYRYNTALTKFWDWLPSGLLYDQQVAVSVMACCQRRMTDEVYSVFRAVFVTGGVAPDMESLSLLMHTFS